MKRIEVFSRSLPVFGLLGWRRSVEAFSRSRIRSFISGRFDFPRSLSSRCFRISCVLLLEGNRTYLFLFGTLVKTEKIFDTGSGKLEKATLGQEWQRYEIDMNGQDLTRIKRVYLAGRLVVDRDAGLEAYTPGAPLTGTAIGEPVFAQDGQQGVSRT